MTKTKEYSSVPTREYPAVTAKRVAEYNAAKVDDSKPPLTVCEKNEIPKN